jgi:NTP pyrophosphatase (non-canonical NTP hydrolase)
MEIALAQELAWKNKLAKGFNTSEVPLEFCLLQGEIAEAFDAWRHQNDNLDEELADIAIFLLSLAEMTGVNLQDAIERKIAKNSARSYIPDPKTGIPIRMDK